MVCNDAVTLLCIQSAKASPLAVPGTVVVPRHRRLQANDRPPKKSIKAATMTGGEAGAPSLEID
jgi:hypothetical protein